MEYVIRIGKSAPTLRAYLQSPKWHRNKGESSGPRRDVLTGAVVRRLLSSWKLYSQAGVKEKFGILLSKAG